MENENVLDLSGSNEPTPSMTLGINQEVIQFKQAEWVFQFDKGEPTVFAWCNDSEEPGDLSIKLSPNSSSNIEFKDRDGRSFKIYAREITEPTLKMLEQDGSVDVDLQEG